MSEQFSREELLEFGRYLVSDSRRARVVGDPKNRPTDGHMTEHRANLLCQNVEDEDYVTWMKLREYVHIPEGGLSGNEVDLSDIRQSNGPETLHDMNQYMKEHPEEFWPHTSNGHPDPIGEPGPGGPIGFDIDLPDFPPHSENDIPDQGVNLDGPVGVSGAPGVSGVRLDGYKGGIDPFEIDPFEGEKENIDREENQEAPKHYPNPNELDGATEDLPEGF